MSEANHLFSLVEDDINRDIRRVDTVKIGLQLWLLGDLLELFLEAVPYAHVSLLEDRAEKIRRCLSRMNTSACASAMANPSVVSAVAPKAP